jgi:hypothetical protein
MNYKKVDRLQKMGIEGDLLTDIAGSRQLKFGQCRDACSPTTMRGTTK